MRVATALSPYHRQLLAAERRMFASPRLRAVICNSRMVREEIQRWFGVSPERLHVIYNGVDLEHFHPRLAEVHRGSMRRSLGIGEHERLVLFVGNGFQRKGLPQLLRALALLPTHVHLAVVGEDRARAPLESLSGRLGLDRRVHWIGGQGDVRPWYAAGDVLALPTLYDPFPNVVLESLACGLPVVTSGTCGAAEIILDGKNGIVCPDALDIESLATALERTASAGEAWRAAARASAEPFSIERTARDLVGLYRGLLGEGALAASGK
jgi:UDP-glucose:(heptosyl)LPS alpha-1,3-glucosyltransferase